MTRQNLAIMDAHDGELEFAISQYVDGTLPADAAAALDERFARDAAARALLGQYQALNAHLLTALPLPALRWEALSTSFSTSLGSALDDLEKTPASFPIFRYATVGRLALAASIFMIAGLGLLLVKSRQPPESRRVGSPVVASAVIAGPAAETAAGPVLAEVSVGPSPTVAQTWRSGDEVLDRPTVVLIDRAAAPSVDNEPIY